MKKALILCEKRDYSESLVSFLEAKDFYPYFFTQKKEYFDVSEYDFIFLTSFFEDCVSEESVKILFALSPLEEFTRPIHFWAEVDLPIKEKNLNCLLKKAGLFLDLKKREKKILEEERQTHSVIGQSIFFKFLRDRIYSLSQGFKACLFVGEKGVGCEYIAKAVHYHSPQALKEKFFSLRSKNVDEELLTYHLQDLSSVLFLKRIENLNVQTQELLLKGFENFKNKKVWASSLGHLETKIQSGEFSRKLYEQFVVSLKIPSLKDRREDIPLLARYFLEETCRSFGCYERQFSYEVLNFFAQKHWPDNVRGLKRAVMKAFFQNEGKESEIRLKDFIPHSSDWSYHIDFRQARDLFERDFILKALRLNKGHVTRTAQHIGLERTYLHKRLKLYGLDSQG